MASQICAVMIQIDVADRLFLDLQFVQRLNKLFGKVQCLCSASLFAAQPDKANQMHEPLDVCDCRQRGLTIMRKRIEQWPQFFVKRQIPDGYHMRQHQSFLGRSDKCGGQCRNSTIIWQEQRCIGKPKPVITILLDQPIRKRARKVSSNRNRPHLGANSFSHEPPAQLRWVR
jgi:hypothetical protein